MSDAKKLSSGPLTGVRVLEFGQIAAGPFTGSLFADLGADVVKVERPDGGDGMRSWPPLKTNANNEVFSENFASLNRNKRSIAVDLKNPASVQRLLELAPNIDVIIENFRPSVLDRLGLGYEKFKEINPAIIFCAISGYGQKGPYSHKGAFDVTVQGMSGLMSVTGEDGAPPVKSGVPVADFSAGLYAAFTIAATLLQTRETGIGRLIDCSMLGSLLGVAALQTSEYLGTGKVPRRLGSAHPRNAPYQAFSASDTYFIIAAGNDHLWQEVADAVGLTDLKQDPRFGTQQDRAANQKDLFALLQPELMKRTSKEWLEIMDSRGVPCSPILNYEEVLSDPHVQAMNIVQPLTLPNGVKTETVVFPIGMSNFNPTIYRAPPQLGAHTEEVLDEWASPYSASEGGD